MQIAVLGAGISGLAAAWFLKQRFGSTVSLSIYEKNYCPGGWIKSKRVHGFLFEEGPRSCRSRAAGAATLSLLETLGMASEVVVASPSARKRYLYHQGNLQPVPGLLSMLTSPLTRDVIPTLWKEWWQAPACTEDESIYDFISRRFNSELAERLVDPMTSGIYAGNMRCLSMRSCFPQVFQWEREYGSVMGGMFRSAQGTDVLSPFVKKVQKEGAIFSLKSGMESLVTGLASQLKEELILNTLVDNIEVKNNKIYVNSSKEARGFDRILCALPAAEALKICAPHLKESLCMPAASVATVGMGWKEAAFDKKGFGYLVAQREQQDILGVVFDSAVFPQQNIYPNETRLTVMLGGAHRPEIAQLPHEAIASLAKEAVDKHLGICREPDAWHVNVAKEAIPQYLVGHAAQVERIKEEVKKLSPGIKLLGSSWHGVAVNDCITEAATVTQSLV